MISVELQIVCMRRQKMQASLKAAQNVQAIGSADAHPASGQLPRLESGDQMAQPEFHRRYVADPTIHKAELVEGVVYVSSPVRSSHGGPHGELVTWLNVYRASTPGTIVYDNVTFVLDIDNEVQPDACLFLTAGYGGRVKLTEEGYCTGAPELVVEVAASSASYDLRHKRNLYRRHGVHDYIVAVIYERVFRWFRWDDGQSVGVEPDAHGIFRSTTFPGLWLDSVKFWAGDLAGVLATVQEGIQSPEHDDFVHQLGARIEQGRV
jgi:Uma2 family endonuclease